ncbi:hypothetical protein K461DRAFT_270824 [Myriangium duriaei CBS 260.36]|uniref:Uncharacterized protein n=1 Tax=Myriangium duriaei CBS 260.36 TaxID=1168546 RepID=A0A9P4IVG2_9PEZI|nr:hypothetical protein K461DRAFT_270824 [Myriangium duriaei CBS 260.36]
MAERLKQEIKANALHRQRINNSASKDVAPPQAVDLQQATVAEGDANLALDVVHHDVPASMQCNGDAPSVITFGRSEAVLFMFYVEKLLPFLFPFYRPSLLEGGKAWILEMMLRRPVIRQVVLCQSLYFSLPRGTTTSTAAWKQLLTQTQDAVTVLRNALQMMQGSHVAQHLHGAVRIMSSILQLQRFEVAVLSFDNWPTHLNAALELFKQLLDAACDSPSGDSRSRFNAVMRRLGPSSEQSPMDSLLPTSEQAALPFSASILLFDDIIASTVLREQPRLYDYHRSLLEGEESSEAVVNLEAVIGVKNEVMLAIGEISALDAWKQQGSTSGSLDILELTRRAIIISNSVRSAIKNSSLEDGAVELNSPLDVFEPYTCPLSEIPADLGILVTQVWAHGALIYLTLVVTGWQPDNADLRSHVDQVVKLLSDMTPPALLRTMIWPFCVAGCLAEPCQGSEFRAIVQKLNRDVCGTAYKALGIMEHVWQSRHNGDGETRDLAMCFRSHGDLPLLV